MKTGINEALILTLIMAAVIFFCRLFPFLFFRGKTGDMTHNGKTDPCGKRTAAFLAFVEKTVPPVAMTVLAFNALAGPAKSNPRELPPALIAAAFTALVHLWRRNPLISIFGGTALYMLLIRVFA
jgi:branched-subunit amino acid transport protein AzlD